MGILSCAGALWLGGHAEPGGKDLTLWVFASPQFTEYNEILGPMFQRASRRSLEVDLIPERALDMRLPVLFMSPHSAKQMPDAVEVEVGSIGRYLRPPADEVGFLPLNRYLATTGFREIDTLNARGEEGWSARLSSDGKIYTFSQAQWRENPIRHQPDAWIDRILPSRLVPATKDGQIFAVPHDVHPVSLSFREDLFREAGVPLIDEAGRSTAATWPEFQEKCLRFQSYWRVHGYPMRHAIEFPSAGAGMLSIMLLQRHINLIGIDHRAHLNDPRVAQTLAFYAQLVAGERAIAGDAAEGTGLEYHDIAEGNLCALLTPDWKIGFLRQYAPWISGKMRMIALPRFDPADAPTASYGGTLVAIPRGSPHPDEAWKLIEFLYFSNESLAGRSKAGILPPLPEVWDDAQYHHPDPFFGGQKTLELYTALARQCPPVHATPVTPIALGTLSYVQSQAVSYVRAHGRQGLEDQCQHWLDAAAIDLQRRIDHARFEER